MSDSHLWAADVEIWKDVQQMRGGSDFGDMLNPDVAPDLSIAYQFSAALAGALAQRAAASRGPPRPILSAPRPERTRSSICPPRS